MKIFLDDIRNPKDCLSYMHTRIGSLNPIYNEEWIIARNYPEFQELVAEYAPDITHVSFDHDLADEHYNDLMNVEDADYNALYDTFKERTGYDCAKFLLEYYKDTWELPIIFVHSMNPVGTQNILNVFK